MDYCEQKVKDGKTLVYIGLQFEDEPDSLYVAELELGEDEKVKEWKLYYNGFDCKYGFRDDEKMELVKYAMDKGIGIRT